MIGPEADSPGDDMSGAVALVTGGTGIGAATARLLARRGLRVVIVGRRPELLAQVDSDAITAIPADLGEAGAPHRVVAGGDRRSTSNVHKPG